MEEELRKGVLPAQLGTVLPSTRPSPPVSDPAATACMLDLNGDNRILCPGNLDLGPRHSCVGVSSMQTDRTWGPRGFCTHGHWCGTRGEGGSKRRCAEAPRGFSSMEMVLFLPQPAPHTQAPETRGSSS